MRNADGSLVFFDTKWTSAQPLPADYVLFRSLFFVLSAASPFIQAGLPRRL